MNPQSICWQEVVELVVSLVCLTIVEALIIIWQPAQSLTFEQLKNYSLWLSAPYLAMTIIVKGSRWVLDYLPIKKQSAVTPDTKTGG